MQLRHLALAITFATLAACGGGSGFETGTMGLSLTDAGARGHDNVSVAAEPLDRVEHDCPRNATVIVGFGQSNSANNARGLRNPDNPKLLNFYRGRCYLARDPLLGASGKGGSMLTALGESLVARGETVVLVSLGVGGTSVSEWASGKLNTGLRQTLKSLIEADLAPSYVLWHQGERDAALGTADYAAQFGAVVGAIRESGVQAPVYAAVATRCFGRAPNESLRSAQLSLPSLYSGVRQGPDTDALGSEYRPDGCHLLAELHARLWLHVLSR